MKKTTYTKPEIQEVRIQATSHILGLSNGRAVESVSNSDGLSFDRDGVDSDDDLR